MATYPSYIARGSARELGLQHGSQAARQIRGYLEFLTAGLKITREELRARALQFEPLMRSQCPQLIDEITGLAEGADLPFADGLAAQMRGELGQVASGGCTTFAIGPAGTANGEPLVGQTSDNPFELIDYGYVLHIIPDDRPEAVMWTFGGMLGYHGLNQYGVSHFANSLGGGPAWKFALSHYPLKRLIFEQRNVADVVRLMQSFPVCSNGNYMLCDGQGTILDVELTSEGPREITDSGAGFLAHSNHYVCSQFACPENFEKSLPDSFPRLARMQELIREKFGQITLADVQGFLSDHAHFPVGICRHAHEGPDFDILPSSGKTVAAMIAEPARGTLHVSCGNPCENPFIPYQLEQCPNP